MKYGSVCSGIEAATVAWHPLGWEPQFFSEIDPFACAALKHHYPKVKNNGDMTKFKEWNNATALDVLVGGTPCQSYSQAKTHRTERGGISDPRGALVLTYTDILEYHRPRYFVWENVPGCQTTSEGSDFLEFCKTITEIGYCFAVRVLNACNFGVPQNRERVFVVGHLGTDWQRPASILFERNSHGVFTESIQTGSIADQRLSPTLTRNYHRGVHSGGEGYICEADGRLRRYTPVEAERLQGFTDGYTDIPWRGKLHSPDSLRYKALGNSMCVPNMRWLGERIQMVDAL